MYVIDINKTASAGEWSFNTLKIAGGILKQVIIKSTSNDNTYDFQMIDNQNNYAIDTTITGEGAIGTFNKVYEIPLRGIYTIKVLNAVTNEVFTGRLFIIEGY